MRYMSFSSSEIGAVILCGTHRWELFMKYDPKMAKGFFGHVFLSPTVTPLSLGNVLTSSN